MKGSNQLILALVGLLLTIVVGAMLFKYALDKGDVLHGGSGSDTPGGGADTTSYATANSQSVVLSKASSQATLGQLNAYLRDNAGDQLKDAGGTFYELGKKYDVDPTFAIAVSQFETSLSKNTCSRISHSCNNFFCMEPNEYSDGTCARWASYSSVSDGIEAFYQTLKDKYISKDRDTVGEISCAPGSGYVAKESKCYCKNEETGDFCENWPNSIISVMDAVKAYEA